MYIFGVKSIQKLQHRTTQCVKPRICIQGFTLMQPAATWLNLQIDFGLIRQFQLREPIDDVVTRLWQESNVSPVRNRCSSPLPWLSLIQS